MSWTRYVKKCAELVDGLDVAVVSFNEPLVFLLGGYLVYLRVVRVAHDIDGEVQNGRSSGMAEGDSR